MTRPNIVFIITDQHRADHLGCYGNPIVRTPHIDSLAAHGWRAEHFYVANPACMPNRATLMTGRMPSLHGVRANGIPLPANATTFVELLAAAGYATVSCGKIHLQPMTADGPIWRDAATTAAEHQAPPPHLADARHPDVAASFYEQERIHRWQQEPDHDLQLPYYGFQEVHLTMMHADEAHGHYGRWLAAQDPDIARRVGPEHAHDNGAITALQAWRTVVPEHLYSTHYIGERACEFLHRHHQARPTQPFFLQISFNDPHHPFTPPGKYWDMYDPATIPLPAAYAPPSDTAPPPLRHLVAERDSGRADRNSWMLQAVSATDVRQAIALTYGAITFIDDTVGKVLATLDQLGLRDNTVVIFTSDHGDFMGDHQLMFKGPMHYQGLIRVPFIWNDPALPHRNTTLAQPAGTLDIARTILARAGLAPYHGMQGEDLVQRLHDPTPNHRAMVVEEDNQRTFLGFDRPVRLRTLVAPPWRLTVYRGVDWGELYNLDTDPHEHHNLWHHPDHQTTRTHLLWQLVQHMQDLADDSPMPRARA